MTDHHGSLRLGGPRSRVPQNSMGESSLEMDVQGWGRGGHLSLQREARVAKAGRGQSARRAQVQGFWARAGAAPSSVPSWGGTSLLLQPGAAGGGGAARRGVEVLQRAPGPRVPTASKRDCLERFGPQTLERIARDDHVICSTEHSRIVPLENGEVGPGATGGGVPTRGRVAPPLPQSDPLPRVQIVVSLVNGRPGARNFSSSPLLREFTKASNVRLRLLRTNTLLGHLMGKALRDPTVTRRVRRGRGMEGLWGRQGSAGAGGHGTHWPPPPPPANSTTTASRTLALAAAVSAMATRTSVMPKTPQTPTGEACCPHLPHPLPSAGSGRPGSTAHRVPRPAWPPLASITLAVW